MQTTQLHLVFKNKTLQIHMERENNGRFKKKTSNSLIEENEEGNYEFKFQLPNLMTLFCWFLFVIITIPWFIILLNSNILTKSGYLIKDALGVYIQT